MRSMKLAGTLMVMVAVGPVSSATGRELGVAGARIGQMIGQAGAQFGASHPSAGLQHGVVVPSPPPPWAVDDPADSVYRAARAALADGDYQRAAALFHRITTSYPQSTYARTALYYEAFALYRSGETADLRQALAALRTLSSRDGAGVAQGDVPTLRTRICSALARQGDESCAEEIAQQGQLATDSCPSEDDENNVRIAALNALMQMDGDRALPILRKVLARRDACSVALRRKALFLVSQRETSASIELLLSTARQDPDEGVREQAVFWLSHIDDPHVVDLLDSIALEPGNDALREKAVFALAQQTDHRSSAMLRALAERADVPTELREKAVFFLGQSSGVEGPAALKELFGHTTSESLKEKILFSLSQHSGEGDWILDVAQDARQPEEVRKQGIFWAAQGGVPVSRLLSTYGQIDDSELRQQLIFALAQRREPTAADALMHIAKTDKDREARRKAVFWLGQSSDPRAAQFLQELINQ